MKKTFLTGLLSGAASLLGFLVLGKTIGTAVGYWGVMYVVWQSFVGLTIGMVNNKAIISFYKIVKHKGVRKPSIVMYG